MKEIKFTLLADGSSDKTFLRIIKWLMNDKYPKIPIETVFADFRELPNPPKSLKEKLNATNYYFPYDILFIHRDAESTSINAVTNRLNQIKNEIGVNEFEKTVCIIPIKMMETWLLIDSEAIKKASGNRNFSGIINLPSIKNLEKENNPKKILHDLLEQTSGLKGRNLHKFKVDKAVHYVAENILDFSPLRQLSAFCIFETNFTRVIDNFLENKK